MRTAVWCIALLLSVTGCTGTGRVADAPTPIAATPDPTSAAPTPSVTPSTARAPSTPRPPAPMEATVGVPARAQRGVVERVVDGDTIWVRVDEPGGLLPAAATHKIRLLLVDTPEVMPPAACFGHAASDFTTDQLLGATVWLEADEQDTDRYGRFLRHVWLADGTNFNLELVERGYADAVVYPPNDLHWPAFSAAAEAARWQRAGLWGACDGSGAAAAAPRGVDGAGRTTTRPAAPQAADAGCDLSYPTVCIPPPPPDLDCGSIAERRFTVAGPDPHSFDGNHDGVACEGP